MRIITKAEPISAFRKVVIQTNIVINGYLHNYRNITSQSAKSETRLHNHTKQHFRKPSQIIIVLYIAPFSLFITKMQSTSPYIYTYIYIG